MTLIIVFLASSDFRVIVRHFGFIWNSFLSNKLCFFDLTILKIEDDDGCQPITSTPVKDRAGGST